MVEREGREEEEEKKTRGRGGVEIPQRGPVSM